MNNERTRKTPPAASRLFTFHYSLLLERETGIEPATNSLEGCDSTTELLPPKSALPRFPGVRTATLPESHLDVGIFQLGRRYSVGNRLWLPRLKLLELAKGFEPPTL